MYGIGTWVIIEERDLTIRVVYVGFARWRIGSGGNFPFDKPQTEMLEYFLDDLVALNETDDSHSALTFVHLC